MSGSKVLPNRLKKYSINMIDRNKSLDQDVSLEEPVCMKNESVDADKERPSSSNKDQSNGAQNVTDNNNS